MFQYLDMNSFVDTLQWWLARRDDLTPTTLARQADLDKTTVRQMIEHDRWPRVDTAIKICAALNVTLDQFFARDDHSHKTELIRLLSLLTDEEIGVLRAAAQGLVSHHREEERRSGVDKESFLP